MKLHDIKWDSHKTNQKHVHNNPKNLQNVKTLLDSTGCGFCLAKFRQVTLHLGTGMTHSCHHPSPHKIPLEEIQRSPSALFNTNHLKHARKEMLRGEKPSECDYCWRVEDNGGVSDRFYKSIEPWALQDHDEIQQLTGDEDIYPAYLEVSFSNACNLKCTYCGPEFSSSWVSDLKHAGPIKIKSETVEEWAQGWQDLDSLNFKAREFNPYVDAFWKWFPEASKHLKHYRITGGEPLMNKETFRSMDHFIENPNLDLEFSINSNFSVDEKLWKKFIEKLNVLKVGHLKKITIYTSIEGWGPAAEYARTNLEFELLKKRTEEVLELGNVRVVIMSAFNIFSITTFQPMLEWVLQLKKTYNPNNTLQHIEESTGFLINASGDTLTNRRNKSPDQSILVGIDIPYLRHPTFLDVQMCTHDLVTDYLIPTLNFMSDNTANAGWQDHQGFEGWEVEKLKRIVHHRMYHNRQCDTERETHIDLVKERYKFYDFVNAIDARRGTSFLNSFPEMESFYESCKYAKEYYIQWWHIEKEKRQKEKALQEAT